MITHRSSPAGAARLSGDSTPPAAPARAVPTEDCQQSGVRHGEISIAGMPPPMANQHQRKRHFRAEARPSRRSVFLWFIHPGCKRTPKWSVGQYQATHHAPGWRPHRTGAATQAIGEPKLQQLPRQTPRRRWAGPGRNHIPYSAARLPLVSGSRHTFFSRAGALSGAAAWPADDAQSLARCLVPRQDRRLGYA